MTHRQPQHWGVVYLIRGVVIKFLWVYFCPWSSAGKLGGYVRAMQVAIRKVDKKKAFPHENFILFKAPSTSAPCNFLSFSLTSSNLCRHLTLLQRAMNHNNWCKHRNWVWRLLYLGISNFVYGDLLQCDDPTTIRTLCKPCSHLHAGL